MGAGTRTTGVVLCHQIHALDLAERKARFVEKAPDFVVNEVIKKIAAILEGT
jgi:mRNA interferase ChpB